MFKSNFIIIICLSTPKEVVKTINYLINNNIY